MFQGSIREFKGSYKEVLRVFQVGVSRKFEGVSSKFKWCFKKVYGVFQGSFNGVF